MGQLHELTGPGLERAGMTIRQYLMPHWADLQDEWVRSGSQADIPDVLSTDTCRASSLFARHVLREAGFGDWTVIQGDFHWANIESVPLAVSDPHGTGAPDKGMTCASHGWLKSEDGQLYLDITIDQFGYEPAVAAMMAGSVREYDPFAEQDDIYADPYVTHQVGEWLCLPEEAHLTPDATARGEAADLVEKLRLIHAEMTEGLGIRTPAP